MRIENPVEHVPDDTRMMSKKTVQFSKPHTPLSKILRPLDLGRPISKEPLPFQMKKHNPRMTIIC